VAPGRGVFGRTTCLRRGLRIRARLAILASAYDWFRKTSRTASGRSAIIAIILAGRIAADTMPTKSCKRAVSLSGRLGIMSARPNRVSSCAKADISLTAFPKVFRARTRLRLDGLKQITNLR
jgi:hypothetical protein